MINIQLARYLYSKVKFYGKVRFAYSTIIGKFAKFEGKMPLGKILAFLVRWESTAI